MNSETIHLVKGGQEMAGITKYCPLMLIGFDPPNNNKNPDARTCHPDCMWYNEIDDDCNINIIAGNIDMIRAYIEDPQPPDYWYNV